MVGKVELSKVNAKALVESSLKQVSVWAGRNFVQVEARKSGSTVGSGLGQSFCRLAVEAQGGRIWLKSGTDQGTTVTFTLPASVR